MEGLTGEEITAQLNGVMGKAFDDMALEIVPDILNFAKVGEGMGETLVRLGNSLTVVNGTLGWLGASLFDVSVAGGAAAAGLADLFGRLEEYMDAITEYYEIFYTESEQWAVSAHTVAQGFADLGMKMPKTNAELRSLIDGLDLTTRAGQGMFASLVQLAPAFDEVIGQIERVGQAMSDMFQGSITSIQLSVMDDASKYDYWRTQTDMAYEKLALATDPVQIERWAALLNEGAMNAYGLLGGEQRPGAATDFVAYLEKADALTQDRLDVAQAILQNDAAVQTARTEAMFTRVTDKFTIVAGKFMEAASKIVDAPPRRVDVTISAAPEFEAQIA